MNSYERFALWSGGADNKPRVTCSGDIVQFISHERQQLRVKVQIQPVQEGTGDPSPDNVRPITGWNAVQVTRTGKNLFNKASAEAGFLNSPGTGITRPDAENLTSDFIRVYPGKRYAYSSYPSAQGAGYWTGYAFYSDRDMSSVQGQRIVKTALEVIITIPDGVKYIRIGSRYLENGYAQFEIGSSATQYEPYQGDTYTTTFPDPPGTVYGGVLSLQTGELRVDKGYTTVGDHTWTYEAAYNRMIADINNVAIGYPTRTIPFLCSAYQPIDDRRPLSQVPNYSAYFGGLRAVIFIHDDRYTTGAAFKEAMNDVQIVYPLNNPITYQLTPQEITALIGTNTIWADAGPVEVTYEQ